MKKSLLTTMLALVASLTAMAAPEVTVAYPVPGSTLDDRQYFASFNLSEGSYTVTEGAKATLECLDTGDIFDSTSFREFMGQVMIAFDTDAITDNGEYELVIPAGALKVSGEPNEKVAFSYILADPSLGATGNFPQITLVSSDPADGANVAAIGENALNKVTFVTSDDAAVNYIGWELWNVTDPENPEWIYQGSENRIDPNRNQGQDTDRWTDGLYITIGGPDQPLIKDNKYEMKLVFCGIGYNPATQQYPTSTVIEQSKELETSIYFNGLTPPTEYSPYVYESVSPDPDNFEVETVEQARFTITYSGLVKPATFTYFQTAGSTPVAGTYEAVGETDADGYASMWEFTVDETVATQLSGAAMFTVTTKDKDGLFVKGNGGYQLNDFNYGINYEWSVGYPDLISVAPEDLATVETLSEITVGNSGSLAMAFSYNASDPARIVDLSGAEIRVLDQPVSVEGNPAQMKWNFEPITASGSYVLIIPKWYFSLGEEFDGTSNKNTSFRYTVDNDQPSEGPVFDLVPMSVTPADGSTVSEISNVVLNFGTLTFCDPMEYPTATLENTSVNHSVIIESQPAVDNDFFNPTEYTFTFNPPVTEEGVYRFTVKKGDFFDSDYDYTMGETGHACDTLVYTFTIGQGGGVDSLAGDSVVADVYSIDGRVVLRSATVADLRSLPAGLYIHNGRKFTVK